MAKITTLSSHHPARHLVFPQANVHTSVTSGLNAYLCTHKRPSYCTQHTHIHTTVQLKLSKSHKSVYVTQSVQLPVLWNKDTTHSHSTVTHSQTSPFRGNLSHFCLVFVHAPSSHCHFSWWRISGSGKEEKSRSSKQEQHMSVNLFHETLGCLCLDLNNGFPSTCMPLLQWHKPMRA